MSDSVKPALPTRVWALLKQPRAGISLLVMFAIFGAGIVFWGGFNTGLEATNTMAFCTGCHEMRDNVYQEYKKTIHYSNRTGVRASCSDCHVPKDWTHKMIRKIQASKEVWGKITGVIDTPEKFEAHRYEMARREWTRMLATDSLECRNCHTLEAMSSGLQTEKAQRRHAKGKTDGQTCIECHYGIAHKEPVGPDGPAELKAKLGAAK